MVSLKEVAGELGISISLVSKVLSGRLGTTGVSEDRRKKIFAKAKELGYEPNRTALALKAGKLGAIGVFIHPWGEAGTGLTDSFLRGFAETLSKTSYHLWLNYLQVDEDFDRRMNAEDWRGRIDALVIAGVAHPNLTSKWEALEKAGLPVVVASENMKYKSLTHIHVDSTAQGRLPTQHLIAKGCVNIAHFWNLTSRRQGYAEALRSAGMKVIADLLVQCPDFKIESGRTAARRLLESGVPFDGIVAQSDLQALGALQELSKRGIRVPEDVRLTGVDDSPFCETSPIPLTSVSSESRTLGIESAKAILEKLAGRPATSRIIEPRLILRASA